MSWTRGDFYVCPDVECACEIMIIMGPRRDLAGPFAPICCCGKVMKKDGPVVVSPRPAEIAVR
jgi:hypothetical protein